MTQDHPGIYVSYREEEEEEEEEEEKKKKKKKKKKKSAGRTFTLISSHLISPRCGEGRQESRGWTGYRISKEDGKAGEVR
ncbi:hypothetical protein CLCR_11357 [Cladophialophora carrionii]|uniref:Uncharacterized protein n=1 Tax=Cladophialophora carrionii TaxID=86049 RepID=A0A1C1CNQ3_9EURO|nr:hypothetical protein CLCR_11357 [Cladophialophora carrionii]